MNYLMITYSSLDKMIATCLGLYMLPSLGPISDWKGLSQRFTVRQLTPHRAARSDTVIGLQSFSVIVSEVFHYLIIMCIFCRILHEALVHVTDGLFHQRVVANAVFPHLDVIRGMPNKEVCGVGEEYRRHRRKSVAHGEKVDVVLSAGGQHTPYHRMRRVGDIALAVVKDQQAVFEIAAHRLDIVKLVGYHTSGSLVCPDPVRKLRVHQVDVKPLILMRRHNQGTATGLKILSEDLA